MITKEQLLAKNGNGILYSETLKDHNGGRRIAKLNGKLQTFKRRPDRFIQPLKIGLRTFLYCTDEDAADWSIE
jgi:hypothetical protein